MKYMSLQEIGRTAWRVHTTADLNFSREVSKGRHRQP